MSLVAEGQKTKATRSEPVRSLGDIGTFGTGGAGDTGGAALVIPQYQGFDFPDLSIGRELTPRVHPNLLPVLGLDIDSAASVNAIVSAPREEPFFLPPVAPMPIPMQDEKESIVIGSSTLFHNRWDCEYKREETGLCSWTGPLEQLCDHFSTTHHHFERTEVPAWTICVKCKNISLGWERGDCDCDPGCWRKLFYGVVPRQSNPNPILTVSEAPGSRSSWFSPSWNMATPGSSNTEQSNLPYRSSTSSAGFYEHSTSGNENSEASDGEGKDEAYRVCRTTQNRCRFQSDAAETTQHTCIGSWFGHPRRRTGARSAFYGSHLSLTPPSKLCRRLIIALLAPLIVFHLRRAHFLHKLRGTLVAFLSSVYCLKLYLALIIILGPLVAWIALGSLRSRANGEVSKPTRSWGGHPLTLLRIIYTP
ncbi:hypothetical protein F4823DRAFT_230957 [Ustulina deusta]|nr:hypothetical protein F4823DRAFT_230957 [Ustulina deusta]